MSDQDTRPDQETRSDQDGGLGRSLVGRVISNKMNKTITVLVERQVRHPLYKKYVRRSTKVHAHDEENACQEGDLVRIASCRPLSKSKSWRMVEILSRAS